MNEESFYQHILRRHHHVSRETLERLFTLYSWHKKCRHYTSIARYKDFEHFWNRHILNSINLCNHITFSDTVLDIGSGGGFPGLVLTALGYNIILSERDRKKHFFLREAIRLMRITPYLVRDSRSAPHNFNVVIARAVAPLKRLLYLTPDVSRETRGLFLKGKQVQSELDEAKKTLQFHHIIHPYQEGVVLEVTWNTSLL